MITLDAWRSMWRELGASDGDEDLFRKVVGCWSEKHRRYHTLQHLRECFEQFDAVKERAKKPAEVMAALWFHDAFYDPERNDNELRSADWARECAVKAGLPAATAQRLHDLVMATCHDANAGPMDEDMQLLVDIDLSILGSEAARFDESDEQIREEYGHIGDADYRTGRIGMLKGFLDRPRLYTTERFHGMLETRARENLQRALARLQ